MRKEAAAKNSLYRQCGSKKRYRDEKDARKILRKCEKERGQKLDYYYCSYCSGWHLTHKDVAAKGWKDL